MPVSSEEAIEHMEKTLLNPVSKSEIDQLGINLPDNIYENGQTHVWGLIPARNNRSIHDQMKQNDVVIFVKRDQQYVTRILGKAENEALAEHLWGRKDGKTYSLIFFVGNLKAVNMKKRELLRSLQYSDRDQLMGTRRVTERIEKIYGSVDVFLQHIFSGALQQQQTMPLVDDAVLDLLKKLLRQGNVLLYGPPGTGKTSLAVQLAKELGAGYMIKTANSLWFRRDVIGGETLSRGSVGWKSGFIIKAYNEAYRLSQDQYYFIIIDEMNRADADKAFGDFFTIFSSNEPERWSIPPDLAEEIKSYKEKDDDGENFLQNYKKFRDEPLKKIRIIATINTADINNLYLLGEALLRRFALVKIPCPGQLNESSSLEEVVKKEVERIINAESLNVSQRTKENAIICVKSIRSRFYSFAQQDDYEKRKLSDFCLSPAAVKMALRFLADGRDHEPEEVIEALKMFIGTLDKNIISEIDEVADECQPHQNQGTQSS